MSQNKRNELQAMLHDANQLIKRIYETKECGKSGCNARAVITLFAKRHI